MGQYDAAMNFSWTATAETLPDAPGAYALMINLAEAVPLPSPRFDGLLAPGRYCYLGSARGPGGIRARCRRHFRSEKSKRWHVDWLTTVATALQASAHTAATECALAEHFLGISGASIPVPGFGSSDCVRCSAHLVWLGDRAQ